MFRKYIYDVIQTMNGRLLSKTYLIVKYENFK